MREFKYSTGDVVGNLEIKGLGGTSKSGGGYTEFYACSVAQLQIKDYKL